MVLNRHASYFFSVKHWLNSQTVRGVVALPLPNLQQGLLLAETQTVLFIQCSHACLGSLPNDYHSRSPWE